MPDSYRSDNISLIYTQADMRSSWNNWVLSQTALSAETFIVTILSPVQTSSYILLMSPIASVDFFEHTLVHGIH